MKVIILAGGYGTRLGEMTERIPKPMVTIGGKPIIWHIMKTYSCHGINDFIICCGYKSEYIKNYFLNYKIINSDFSISLDSGNIRILDGYSENWNVTLVDTGIDSMTGGRLKRLTPYLKNDDLFCLTYGDGVGNIDISESIKFHKTHKKLATLTAAFPTARFGALKIENNQWRHLSLHLLARLTHLLLHQLNQNIFLMSDLTYVVHLPVSRYPLALPQLIMRQPLFLNHVVQYHNLADQYSKKAV